MNALNGVPYISATDFALGILNFEFQILNFEFTDFIYESPDIRIHFESL